MEYLNQTGDYRALYFNVELAQSAREKVLHKSLERTVAEGIEQTAAYMDRCGTDEGHLVVFDRGKEKTWEEKIFHREEKSHDKTIQVWGM